MENSPEKRDDSVITECPVDKVADDSAYSQENDQNSVKYSVTSSGVVKDEKASCSPRSPNQTVPDFHLKREISNLSLSNYLKAVPTRGSQEQDSLTSSRSNLMPKISYTKRSRALPTFYIVNNSLHQVNHAGFNSPRTNTSQVYGGYFPTTTIFSEMNRKCFTQRSMMMIKCKDSWEEREVQAPRKSFQTLRFGFWRPVTYPESHSHEKVWNDRQELKTLWNLTRVYCTYLLQDINFRGWVESVIDNYFALWCMEWKWDRVKRLRMCERWNGLESQKLGLTGIWNSWSFSPKTLSPFNSEWFGYCEI